MADDLFRVFKSVKKLVREKTEDLFGNVTPLEKALREVTDEDTCAVSNSLLRQIAIATHDAYTYSEAAQTIWQGLASQYWQTIYKCLGLLEFMILLGPERCRMDCGSAQMTIRSLTQYRFHDGRREQGGGVRQKAENILKLINDEAYWQAAKSQAMADSEKYSGGIENQPYVSPISSLNLHGRTTNPFFTGPESVPPMQTGLNPFASSFGRGPPPGLPGSGLGGGFGSSGFNPPAGPSPFGASPPAVNPFTNSPMMMTSGGSSSNHHHFPPQRRQMNTGGFYDPGDDFNSNPFGLASESTKPSQQNSEVAQKDTGDQHQQQQQLKGSLLDDDDLFDSSAPPRAPPASNKSASVLLPDLLD